MGRTSLRILSGTEHSRCWEHVPRWTLRVWKMVCAVPAHQITNPRSRGTRIVIIPKASVVCMTSSAAALWPLARAVAHLWPARGLRSRGVPILHASRPHILLDAAPPKCLHMPYASFAGSGLQRPPACCECSTAGRLWAAACNDRLLLLSLLYAAAPAFMLKRHGKPGHLAHR